MGVTTHSKNQEAAVAFVEWFYSDAWYPDYINFVSSASSMTNFPKEKDPVLAEADTSARTKYLSCMTEAEMISRQSRMKRQITLPSCSGLWEMSLMREMCCWRPMPG